MKKKKKNDNVKMSCIVLLPVTSCCIYFNDLFLIVLIFLYSSLRKRCVT